MEHDSLSLFKGHACSICIRAIEKLAQRGAAQRITGQRGGIAESVFASELRQTPFYRLEEKVS